MMMGKQWAFAVLALGVGWCVYAGDFTWYQQPQRASDPTLVAAYKGLISVGTLKGRAVSNETLARPAFTLTLVEGTLAREDAALPGDVHALYFTGKAAVDFSVSEPMERAHMKLLANQEEWHGVQVKDVLILGTGPGEVLTGTFDLGVTAPPEWSDLKAVLHMNGLNTLAELYDRASRSPRDVLVLFTVGKDLWCYRFDSEEEESMALLKLGRPPGTDVWWWDAAVSLNENAAGVLTWRNSIAEVAAKYREDVTHVAINLAIAASGETRGDAAIDVTPLKAGRTLLFAMDPLLAVAKVRTGDGAPLPFLQLDYSKAHSTEESGLLVLLPEETKAPLRLVVEYSGELFEGTGTGTLRLKQEDLWYPVLSDPDGASFDITMTVPDKFEAITIGDLADRSASGGTTTFHYRFADKTSLASMSVGKFIHYRDRVADLDVDAAFPNSPSSIMKPSDHKSILTMTYNCLKIYSKLCGPPRYSKLSISECSVGHGRGFPTLLLLSSVMAPYLPGYTPSKMVSSFELDQALVSHEAAHQWWGNIVQPLTYRDTWISEGLAQLCSFDYAMVIFGPDRVRTVLTAVAENMDARVPFVNAPVWREGPILLGARLNTTRTPVSAYQPIVYDKTAWAMANLRKVSLASTGSMQPFYDALQDFLKTYSGGKASTQDFQRIMEKHLRMDLAWFFTQYFLQAEIPSAIVKAHCEEGASGWKLVIDGTQDLDYRLYIPVTFTIAGKGQEVVFRMDGRQGHQEFPLTGKPSDIKVNPLGDTLARVKS